MTDALDIPYALKPAAIDAFARQGFVKLKKVLDKDTIAEYEPAITSKVLQLNTQHLPLEQRDTYQKAFLQVENLWEHSNTVRRLVFSRRLAQIAAGLLRVDGIRLYHDQALYKEPGGGITPWHADQYYWPLSTDRCCTVWIPLQETPLDMGPLSFSVGSHTFEFGRDLPISDESEESLQNALAEQHLPVVTEPFEIGDVSYHLGWTFHHAEPNRSLSPRRVMTIIYMDAAIRVAEPVNNAQRGDLANSMTGASPGEIPDTPMNPILYPAARLR